MTSIEWTDAVWNPVVGCSRVSAGCEHCYAERVAHRGMSEQHRGLTVLGKKGPRWTGEVRFLRDRLAEPFGWRKPRRVFVNSMSDLFHESLSFEESAAVFGVMAAAHQHTFQVLTKRPERAREFFAWAALGASPLAIVGAWAARAALLNAEAPVPADLDRLAGSEGNDRGPLRNVWLGVSVEDQRTANERIPVLLETPAALRWVSYEPALGPVSFDPRWLEWLPLGPDEDGVSRLRPPLRWIVVGGESGPGARPFDLAWARSTIAQARAAGVPCFVKQLGARPIGAWVDVDGVTREPPRLDDRKGGDVAEWPFDLRVREWPSQSMEAVR